MLQTLTINGDRLKQDLEALAEIGATVGGGISRLALSIEDLEARLWFANQIEEAGLLVRDDEVGNLSGVLLSSDPDAKTYLMGSHLDTVPNGGCFDGAVGVLAGLEILRTIKEAGLKLPVHLEAINFTDEEGTWQSFFGSMGLTGTLRDAHVNDSEQDNGVFRMALYRAGINSNEVHRARRDPGSIAGYLELHIEQSETLALAGAQIGVVTTILGRSTYNFDFFGEATHAATTSREKQRDALQGAASFIMEMHRMVREDYPGGVVNCGSVRVLPGAYNVVPQQASLRVECRHYDEHILREMESRLIRLAQDCARQYRLSVSAKQILSRPVAKMNQEAMDAIMQVCIEQGRRYMPVISYAGHDAQIVSAVIPNTAMIFIPSIGGISHSPKELTHWEDIEAGANVMLHTLLRMIGV